MNEHGMHAFPLSLANQAAITESPCIYAAVLDQLCAAQISLPFMNLIHQANTEGKEQL